MKSRARLLTTLTKYNFIELIDSTILLKKVLLFQI